MTTLNGEDPDDPSAHHRGCPTPDGCSENGCHGACLPDEEIDGVPDHLWGRIIAGVVEAHKARPMCRDCADLAPDGICPNSGKPCRSESPNTERSGPP